jgi:hypothetical protein
MRGMISRSIVACSTSELNELLCMGCGNVAIVEMNEHGDEKIKK